MLAAALGYKGKKKKSTRNLFNFFLFLIFNGGSLKAVALWVGIPRSREHSAAAGGPSGALQNTEPGEENSKSSSLGFWPKHIQKSGKDKKFPTGSNYKRYFQTYHSTLCNSPHPLLV